MSTLLQFACRQCGKSLKAPTGLAGRKGRCPRCSTVFVIDATDAPLYAAIRPEAARSAVTTTSRLLSVLESLIGPVPFGMAATARWSASTDFRPGIVRSIVGALALRHAAEPHVGCIAVRDYCLHLFDFGKRAGDAPVSEGHLYHLVRHGATPNLISAPLSALVVKKALSFSCQAVLVTGALRLQMYPGLGEDFPGPLWTALSPVE